MSTVLTALIGFAVLFAVFGVYGLLARQRACGGGCGSCAASEGCSRAGKEDSDLHQISR